MKYRVFRNHMEFIRIYPQIVDIDVLIAERGTTSGIGAGLHTKKLTKEDMVGFVPCSHPTCHNGGLNLTEIIHTMVENKERRYTGVRMCTGELQGHQHCPNEFHVTIRIDYAV